MPADTSDKKNCFIELLETSSVFVCLDPRREGVIVPSHFTAQSQLVLQIGVNLSIPIPDLEIDDDAVRCTLSFNRAPFHCTLPWSAVFALRDDSGKTFTWQTAIPRELSPEPASVRREAPLSRAERKAERRAPQKPSLSVVASPAPATPTVTTSKPESVPLTPEPEPPKGPRERPSWLRVVK